MNWIEVYFHTAEGIAVAIMFYKIAFCKSVIWSYLMFMCMYLLMVVLCSPNLLIVYTFYGGIKVYEYTSSCMFNLHVCLKRLKHICHFVRTLFIEACKIDNYICIPINHWNIRLSIYLYGVSHFFNEIHFFSIFLYTYIYIYINICI